MSDPKTTIKPDLSKAEITSPVSPYDFENLLEESFEIRKKNGELVAVISCREATGKESTALSIISNLEGSACDAYLESRGAKIEKLQNGREVWRFPEGSGLSLDESNFLSFRRRVYPKLAACSTCNLERLPTAEEAWKFRESELEKWYSAALKVNPTWFDEFRNANKQQVLNEIAQGNGSRDPRLKKKLKNQKKSEKN